jgi:hypothetical protein
MKHSPIANIFSQGKTPKEQLLDKIMLLIKILLPSMIYKSLEGSQSNNAQVNWFYARIYQLMIACMSPEVIYSKTKSLKTCGDHNGKITFYKKDEKRKKKTFLNFSTALSA